VKRCAFDALVSRALRAKFADRPTWRQNFPASGAALAPDAQSPAAHAMRSFVRERLDEARATLARMTEDDLLAAAFEDMAPLATPANESAAPPDIKEADVLVLGEDRGVVVSVHGDGDARTLLLQYGDTQMTFPAQCEPLFRRLVAERRLTAKDAVSWFPAESRIAWEDVRPVLSLLVTHGLLAPAAGAHG
jgi:hypothetical protein